VPRRSANTVTIAPCTSRKGSASRPSTIGGMLPTATGNASASSTGRDPGPVIQNGARPDTKARWAWATLRSASTSPSSFHWSMRSAFDWSAALLRPRLYGSRPPEAFLPNR
jgi:hypothetical protein